MHFTQASKRQVCVQCFLSFLSNRYIQYIVTFSTKHTCDEEAFWKTFSWNAFTCLLSFTVLYCRTCIDCIVAILSNLNSRLSVSSIHWFIVKHCSALASEWVKKVKYLHITSLAFSMQSHFHFHAHFHLQPFAPSLQENSSYWPVSLKVLLSHQLGMAIVNIVNSHPLHIDFHGLQLTARSIEPHLAVPHSVPTQQTSWLTN